jgi:Mor family transcriptional regulator
MSTEKLVAGHPCDIIKRFIEILTGVQPSFSEEIAADIERQLRHEYAGERVYIPKRDENLRDAISERFTGRNVEKLARELNVSRSTVYRSISAQRKRKQHGR